MKKEIAIDFYKGYEGYPEICFCLLNGITRKNIVMWEGFFDEFMHAMIQSE